MFERKIIQLVSYDVNWPHIFEQESEVIKNILGDNCLSIHHVGSTSVPGLLAKPVIDIIIIIQDPFSTFNQLKKINIYYSGEYNIPLHYGFSKKGDVAVNLHMYEESHPEIELNLVFRNYLRAHPNKRDEYARFKKILIQDETSFNRDNSPFTNYTLRKGDFIRATLKEAGFNKIRVLKCNDDTEWQAAKYFRNKYFFDPHNVEDPYIWSFNHEEHSHLILYQGIEIIGYAHIQFWPDKRAVIRIIAIDEDKRRQNAGSVFLSFIEKWLKSLGIKIIHAESRQSSLSFYLKNNYQMMGFKDPQGYQPDPKDIPVGKFL